MAGLLKDVEDRVQTQLLYKDSEGGDAAPSWVPNTDRTNQRNQSPQAEADVATDILGQILSD